MPDAGPGPAEPDGLPPQKDQAASPPEPYVPAGPDPEFDNFTWTLPTGASALRLSLPADIEDFFYSEETGVGGFGLHAGGHIEGLDHVWMEVKLGTPVRSWAGGVVEDIGLSGMADQGEYHITIDYGQNLIGTHMEIGTAYVKVGDRVERGQEVGLGLSFGEERSSAEFALIDLGRTDGVIWGGHGGRGTYVSPYDYLEDSEKRKLVAAYKKYIIEPYRSGGTQGLFNMFEPYQPYLTSKLFLHEGNAGKLNGAWYLLSSPWDQGLPHDMMTFIEAKNPYFEGNVVRTSDDRSEGMKNETSINGSFEVDYGSGQLKMVDEHGAVYFGIFEIDESGDRAKLKIEYRKGAYPNGFGPDANTYIVRVNLSRREDAARLGVLAQP